MIDVRRSILEGLISRADRNFGKLLYKAFLLGARFDAYKDGFNPDIWDQAARQTGIDISEYLITKQDNFPWSHIKI